MFQPYTIGQDFQIALPLFPVRLHEPIWAPIIKLIKEKDRVRKETARKKSFREESAG
jgi:hypothetical protein